MRYPINLAANFLGVGWTAVLQLAAIPFYLSLVGIESFGLIGFFTTLLLVSRVFDLGLSSTLNRELARYSVDPTKSGEARDLVRTVELVYWAIAILVGGGIVLAAPLIARHWLNAEGLAESEIVRSISLMGGAIALQLPTALYHGGLMGLQRQVAANLIRAGFGTLSIVGAVLCLYWIAPKVVVFFAWQFAASVVHLLVIYFALWKRLPESASRPRFSPVQIWRNLPFAAGMSGIGISALVLSQLDRLVLSKLLPLELFGYYVLGHTLGSAIYLIITPVFNATLPRLSALVALGDPVKLRNAYRSAVQLMAVLLLPVSLVVVVFAEPLLRVWTGNPEAASQAAPIASLIAAGTALNGLMNPPYALQIAHGWTGLGLRINIFFILTTVPALVLAVGSFGPPGAAAVWLLLNLVYVLIGVPLTHRRLLRGEVPVWFTRGLLVPGALSLLVVLVPWLLSVNRLGTIETALLCLFVALAGIAVASLSANQVRSWLMVRAKNGLTYLGLSLR